MSLSLLQNKSGMIVLIDELLTKLMYNLPFFYACFLTQTV